MFTRIHVTGSLKVHNDAADKTYYIDGYVTIDGAPIDGILFKWDHKDLYLNGKFVSEIMYDDDRLDYQHNNAPVYTMLPPNGMFWYVQKDVLEALQNNKKFSVN